MKNLVDRHGRTFPYLRLSLTEACNYRCSYCLPDGYQADGRPQFLVMDEIVRLVRAFAALGMSKIRLTGGEPSLRKDLPEIIAAVAAIPGVARIALTTNGCLLPRHVGVWRAAGLTALNVSLDSLDPERFQRITGHDRFAEVTEGVDQALGLGFESVKLNAVLLRGLNDDEMPAWLEYLRDRDLAIRFIELMRTGENREYFERHHYRADEVEDRLIEGGWQLRPRAADAGPAREYAHPDYRGRIGIIAPYSKDFCAGCNRLRVTARGDLRLCLFGDFGIALRPLLQDDGDHDALVARIATQLGLKAAGHGLHEGLTGLTPHLASIGG
ncbi:molybdenum cofactor biosynthesis protein A [Lysobacter concretionis Ko07 = DSM 16239]|uniref:GTP 3',8-cyclase n=1 Tax=Lysobacter concretionis Ko07 = DSM 16239 TaxID=1122185 RepID=A0A0A0EMV8_9GAMM|nr:MULTISPECIES: GTP 3',8-cyclase MoaA [Lysobacter]KGM52301.1 molybdenum cofactor biosynthesis protein A [Lysobacter concretionis Ko07 = DSM 16239]QOD91965.1 GTP 3',8-cyclase MoaA [Lysobacter sp. CW239]